MKISLILFSMNDGRNQNMVSAIKSFEMWARVTENAWCVKSEIETTQKLKSAIKEKCQVQDNERLFVVNITDSPWASSNVPQDVADWLKVM